jgi:hypothetical protein
MVVKTFGLAGTPWVAHIQHVFGHAVCFRHPNLDK